MNNQVDRSNKDLQKKIKGELKTMSEKLDTVNTSLNSISINADSVNLNTDGLETLVDETNLRLEDIINQLQTILTDIDSIDTKVATETTLALIKSKTDNLDIALTALRDSLKGVSNKDFSTLDSLIQERLNTLGQKTSANSAPVTIASDQTTIPVNKGTNATPSVVLASDTFVQIVATNTSRLQVIIYNNSPKTLWLKYGAAAVVGEGIPLNTGDALIEDVYRGQINGIWETGSTINATITEVT